MAPHSVKSSRCTDPFPRDRVCALLKPTSVVRDSVSLVQKLWILLSTPFIAPVSIMVQLRNELPAGMLFM